MDAKEYLTHQIASLRNLVDAALAGLTNEQLTWIPPGTANPIGLTALHMLASEDKFISLLRGKERLWQTQNWSGTFNLAEPPDFGRDWTVLRHATLTVESILGYQVVVRVETDFYLDALTPEALEFPIKFFTDHDRAVDVLALLITHTLIHAGEIAALKGVYGVKGLPF
jgi:hypothetical protein